MIFWDCWFSSLDKFDFRFRLESFEFLLMSTLTHSYILIGWLLPSLLSFFLDLQKLRGRDDVSVEINEIKVFFISNWWAQYLTTFAIFSILALTVLPWDLFAVLYYFLLYKKWSFPLGISSVIVTKSAGNCRFGHIYWRNP